MRKQVNVLDEHRKCFGHEDCGVEGPLRQSELFERPAVEAKIREGARFAASRRDHRGRPIDSDDLESIPCQQPAVRRIATRDIQDAASGTFAMPLPDLLQKNNLSGNVAWTFPMRAADKSAGATDV